jgi:hypothetical protein
MVRQHFPVVCWINRLPENLGKPLFALWLSDVCAALRLVTVKLPEKLIADVDQLVKAGIYHSRSDAIRAAVRDLLRRELWQPGQA